MSELNAQRILKRAQKLFHNTERENSESQWDILSEFIIPSQSAIFHNSNNTSPGSVKTGRLFDSTALQSNQDLSAAIHSTLTNPSTKWSKIRFKNDQLNNDQESVQWLEFVNNKIHEVINESNFDTQISKNYQMFTSLGTMTLIAELNDEGGLRFTAWHLAEVAFAENKDGIVDTIYRKFKLTARQAFEKWGKNVGDDIMECLDEKPDEKFEFLHAIFPRDKKDIKLNDAGTGPGKSRPFASVYLNMKNKAVLDESGYYELPVFVTRWSTAPGEVYGRGPGHNAIPDIRTLNTLKDIALHTLAKATNPPLLATSRNVLGQLDLRPGKVNYVRDIANVREFVTQARFDVTQINMEDLKNSIRSAFFLDKLLLPPRTETGEMTAFEIQQRLQQMQRVLGPTLSRLNSELLTPLIVRIFKILLREGQLGQVPPAISDLGLDVDITFVNQLSRAQQVDDINNIQQWLQALAGVAQVKPEVVDWINEDGIARHLAKIMSIPEVAVTNDKEVMQERQQRAQQQQAQQAMEAGVAAADIQSKVGGGQGEPQE